MRLLRSLLRWMDELAYCHDIDTEEVADRPWFHEVKRYLESQEYPEGASANDKKFLRRFSAKFFLSNDILYKRNHDFVLLRCVDKVEAERIMVELHEGTFGTHSSEHTMAKENPTGRLLLVYHGSRFLSTLSNLP